MVFPGKPLGIWRRGNKGKVGIGDKESETLLVAMDTSQ